MRDRAVAAFVLIGAAGAVRFGAGPFPWRAFGGAALNGGGFQVLWPAQIGPQHHGPQRAISARGAFGREPCGAKPRWHAGGFGVKGPGIAPPVPQNRTAAAIRLGFLGDQTFDRPGKPASRQPIRLLVCSIRAVLKERVSAQKLSATLRSGFWRLPGRLQVVANLIPGRRRGDAGLLQSRVDGPLASAGTSDG